VGQHTREILAEIGLEDAADDLFELPSFHALQKLVEPIGRKPLNHAQVSVAVFGSSVS
jgi:hypothetical protein